MGLFGLDRKNDRPEDEDNGADPLVDRTPGLTDVVRGMAHAVMAADEIQDQQYIRLVNRYFTQNDDGTLSPRLVKMRHPVTKEVVAFPLIRFVNPSGLGLDELKVEMSVRMKHAGVKETQHAANEGGKVTRGSFGVEIAPKGRRSSNKRAEDVLDIEMTFRASDPPEGLNRLYEAFDNMGVIPEPEPYDDDYDTVILDDDDEERPGPDDDGGDVIDYFSSDDT